METLPNPIDPEPSRPLARHLTKTNLLGFALATLALTLAIVFFWPRSLFATWLVTCATVLGASAALICGLTWWRKARVQIGRRQLRFKVVRRLTGQAAVISLSFLIVWWLSTSLASRRAEKAALLNAMMHATLPIAIAHLEGDTGHRIEDALVRELKPPKANLPITVLRVDETFTSGPLPKAAKIFNDLNAADYLLSHRAYLMFWGSVDPAGRVPRLYESAVFEGAQFGGTYITSDFKLPELPVADLAPVLRLILTIQSSRVRPFDEVAAAKALSLPIAQVRRLADENMTHSSWNADTRARVNFVLGRISDLQGEWAWDDKPVRISIVDYLSALADWTGPDHALDRAMTLRCLAETLGALSNIDRDRRAQEAAVHAYQEAIGLYDAAGDKLDAAQNEHQLGQTLTVMARGDNGKEFAQAVAAYQSALKPFDKRLYPVEWAEIEYDIAMSLANLGIHETDSQHLRDAVAILNEVLLVRTRDRMPHQWALTQVALGEAFEQLGEREPAGSYFAEAVTAEKSALEVLRPDHDPISWALGQSDLGAALSGVALRDNSIDDFEKSIDALRTGSTDELRKHEPYSWLRAQSVLVMTLDQLGQLEFHQEGLDESHSGALDRSAREHLEEAVTTARASLGEASKDGPPSTWAYLQSKLGDSLGAIGKMEAQRNDDAATDHLKAAVSADLSALRVMTAANDPENWADTENTLGDALQELAKRESDQNYLEQAITAYQQAEKVQTIERDPDSWAADQNSIANVHEVLGLREAGAAGTAHLQQAVNSYGASLKVTTPDHDFMNWLISQRNLARAEFELGSRQSSVETLQQAAAAYREELKYLSPDRSPTEWKVANDGLNTVLEALNRRGASG